MGFIEKGLVIIFICTAFHVSSILCEVYKVGGDAGWTANFDYHTWSSSKTFDVGDIIEFDYTAGDHNVIEVNHTDFRTCNQSRPVVKYTSGNDSITINKRGHYYFICGTPSHCEDGQKVDIRVVPESSKQSTTPSAPAPSNGNRVCTVSFMALLGKAATAALVIFHGFTY
ncbi:mavicyanin-like [Papaver somniferum]|uniref:mavicyanin-like n=1 Tax=Papaver somniferum TaxID=3469 RepID=UPI000E705211|nr:mavicyanin-like [Papaver somniferum]